MSFRKFAGGALLKFWVEIIVVLGIVLFLTRSPHPSPNTEILTPLERQWLKTHSEIVLAPDPNFPPIEYFDEKDVYSGMIAEYFKIIEQRLQVKFRFVHLTSWDRVLQSAKDRKIDGITAAQITPERREFLLYTTPIIDIPNVIITNKGVTGELSFDKMSGMRVELTAGNAICEHLRTRFPQIRVTEVKDDLIALTDVSFNRADATVVNLAIASYLIEKHGITNLHVVGDSGRANSLAIGTRKDYPILNTILEKGLKSLTKAEIAAINHTWIKIDEVSLFNTRRFMATVITALTLVLLVLLWNHMLRKQVEAKTAALKNELIERQRAEEAITKSEARLKAILDHSPSVILIKDLQGKFLLVNRHFETLFHHRPEEVVGKTAFDIFPDPIASALTRNDQETLQSRRPHEVEEEVLRDGKPAFFLATKFPLLDQNNEPYALCTISLDITERKKAEEEHRLLETQLRHTQKLESLGVLAGGIAHDFNNLLMAIMGNLDLAKSATPGNAEARSFLDKAGKASQRAAALCQQMLAYSGKGKFLNQVIDLNHLIQELSKMFEVSISKKAVLELHLQPELPPLEGDPSQISQIIMNLIVNASEALGEKSGTIGCSTSVWNADEKKISDDYFTDTTPSGTYVMLEVTDTGCGMSEETRKKMFDPFFTTKFTGRGLGLAAVLGIIRGHKGLIEVTSKPDSGTTMRVSFPASQGLVKQPQLAVTASDQWQGHGTILLIDDEEALLQVGESMLTRLGFKVLLAADGRQAIELFRSRLEMAHDEENTIIGAIIDLTMPNLDGEETMNELRSLQKDLKIIISSGYSGQEIANRFAGKHLAGFLAKPYRFPELASVLEQIFGRPENRKA